MENTLFDELLQEIFQKLPSSSSSSSSISLVSKRWLHLYRSSKTSLSLRFNNHHHFPSFISLLTQHPSLSSLSLILLSSSKTTTPLFLSAISSSSFSSKLLSLKFIASPVPLSSIISLSNSCTQLSSLSITVSRPVFFNWVLLFPCLKELSIVLSYIDDQDSSFSDFDSEELIFQNGVFDKEIIGLESLCFKGIRGDDWGIDWLWKRCKNLKKLKLLSCQGIGGSYSSFVQCLQEIQQIELKTCRSIVDGVLLKLAQHCINLESLLVHDGGSREGLLHFISNCNSNNLHKLDFRLPMDLENNHLFAMSLNFRGLSILRLQSCCLVTGEGLKALGEAVNNGLQELALINCDVVEREKGLIATLGQQLRQLRKLDLSYNEMLFDKDFVSMIVSCVYLVDLKVRGCKGLTSCALVTMVRSCKRLENVDIMQCLGIEYEAIEVFVKNCSCLRRLEVEGTKLTDAAKMWASNKFIELV
ncbi:dynein regulatory complex subunit 6 [Trifolium pratense]|uniref:dynein regulatory complex subunit 6 n=1 Tax=Trifolium pratense TaxID=57577 RepID=UPI001E692B89|nr:dynein regulatory complex subunit 6 [Trifolium pratense]